jgi:hypothetical protein
MRLALPAMQTMPPFPLDLCDDALSKRMPAAEWRRIVQFRNEPRMLEGLLAYNEIMPEFFAGNLILNKIVIEEWRFYILVFALHLHEARDPSNPLSGLTLSNLQKLCVAQKVASRGRAAVAMGLMAVGGYIRRTAGQEDSRVKRYEPTPKFLEIIENWTNRLLQIIDVIRPGDELARHHREDPHFGPRMRRRGMEVMLEGWRALAPFPEVSHFIHRDAGWMLLLPVIAESTRHNGGALSSVAIDLAAHGKRFGVSRSHFRRLLETAWQAGLLAQPPRNGASILPTPELAAIFVTCMASELGYAHAWAMAAKGDAERDARCSVRASGESGC